MIDFHSHTFFSDGELIPSEHVRRALIAGYKVIGITDHADFSNIEFIYESLYKFTNQMNDSGWDIRIIPGVELTHIPVKKISKIVNIARGLKIPLIVFHGETPVEPVESGSNREAIEAGVDILAHPGFITDEEVKRAAELKVNLEITARKGHSLTNGHVAKLAEKFNAPLVFDTDAHTFTDFFSQGFRQKILEGLGMGAGQVRAMEENIAGLSEKILDRIKI
jgi:putative hydrolase